MEYVKLKTLPHKGIELVTVDGSIKEMLLPGGYKVYADYATLTIVGPKDSPELKIDVPDEIPF